MAGWYFSTKTSVLITVLVMTGLVTAKSVYLATRTAASFQEEKQREDLVFPGSRVSFSHQRNIFGGLFGEIFRLWALQHGWLQGRFAGFPCKRQPLQSLAGLSRLLEEPCGQGCSGEAERRQGLGRGAEALWISFLFSPDSCKVGFLIS